MLLQKSLAEINVVQHVMEKFQSNLIECITDRSEQGGPIENLKQLGKLNVICNLICEELVELV